MTNGESVSGAAGEPSVEVQPDEAGVSREPRPGTWIDKHRAYVVVGASLAALAVAVVITIAALVHSSQPSDSIGSAKNIACSDEAIAIAHASIHADSYGQAANVLGSSDNVNRLTQVASAGILDYYNLGSQYDESNLSHAAAIGCFTAKEPLLSKDQVLAMIPLAYPPDVPFLKSVTIFS